MRWADDARGNSEVAQSIAEALERAAALHDDALRQVHALLRDEELQVPEESLEIELLTE